MYETNINVVVKDHTTYRWIQLIIWACFHITKCLIGSGGFGGVPLKITCFPCFQHIFGKITTSADLRKAYINLATHMHNLVNQNMTPWLEVIAVQKKTFWFFFSCDERNLPVLITSVVWPIVIVVRWCDFDSVQLLV